jgi:hypothetical protein
MSAGSSQSPVVINININLGDLIDKLVAGKKTTREALEEIVEKSEDNARLLVEDNERQ